MFVINEQIQTFQAGQLNSLVSVFQSVNEEEISLGNRVKGKAKAYIYAFEQSPENYSVEVYFHLKGSDESLRFNHERGTVQRFRLKAIEDQALEFVESMGFMMDNLQIQNVPLSQKRDLIQALPMFQGRAAVIKKTESSGTEIAISGVEAEIIDNDDTKQKISRLLASF